MRCSLVPSLAEFLPCSSLFWAPFGAVAPPMILAIEVRIFWVVVRESWGSSASPPSFGIEPSPGAWPVALFRL
jgi:hypothetical protein